MILSHFPLFLLKKIYSYNFCHGTRGVIILRAEGVNGEDYKYNLFPNVVVYCIDIYAAHHYIYSNDPTATRSLSYL